MDRQLRETIDSIISSYRRVSGLKCEFVEASGDEYTYDKDFIGCPLCKLIQHDPDGKANCNRQRILAFQNAGIEKSCYFFICHAGLCEWTVPVYKGNKICGYIVSGFIATGADNKKTFYDQQQLYADKYHISENDYDDAVQDLKLESSSHIRAYTELLLDLIQLNNLWIEPDEKEVTDADVSAHDVVDFLKDEDSSQEMRIVHPLSFYINSENLDSDALKVFWKRIEVRTADIFKNVISGRYLEGSIAFKNLMEFAFAEDDLDKCKTSAEMLYHITSLKYFSKDYFNLEFYDLTFTVINRMLKAKNIREINSILSYAYEQMFQMYNIHNDQPKTNKTSVSKKIVEYLEENYMQDISIETLGKYLYMSPTYLSRLYKTETGFTIKKTLIDIRMKHAQELLLTTNTQIKDIGYAVGYKDIRGFYKMFNLYFGMTCSEMKKKYHFPKR